MNTIKTFAVITLLGITALYSSAVCRKDENWRAKMQAEKIAFLTTEMGLTVEEAEKFWPVYNAAEKDRQKAFSEVFEAYKALDEAVKSGKPEKEISSLLDQYVNAVEMSHKSGAENTAAYKKILPVEKVAKLYLSEEKFRRQQIHRLHKKHN